MREGGGSKKKGHTLTSGVPEVIVGGRVVLAEPLEDEFVVQQAVERPEEEDVKGEVADPLLLKLPTHSLCLPTGPEVQRGEVRVRTTLFRYLTTCSVSTSSI